MIITDGTGGGHQTKVDDNNRVHTLSVSKALNVDANESGRAFNLNTGEITLTSDNESAVMYIKNNEVYDGVITAIAVGFKYSTGGSATDLCTIRVIRNPTTGTIVSDAVDADIISNRNFGSAATLVSNVYKGGEGKTLTNGTEHLLFYQNDGGRLFAAIDEILPRGTTIGIKITPPSGNTSMTCYAAIIGYVEDR